MPTKVKASLDEILSKREGNIVSTPRGDALVKAFKSPASWDAEKRAAKFVMTSETVDRYGDIVRQAGMSTDRFMENPQALLFHDSRSWPVGVWSDITKLLTGRPKRTEGVLNFLPAGKDVDADRAAVHVEHKTIRTVSIGFIPKDWESITDEDTGYWSGYDFTESELIECSLVPIPAQPDALVKDAGGDTKMLLLMVEDILDNWVRTPEGVVVPRADYEKLYEVTVAKISAPAKPKANAQLDLLADKAKTPAAAEAVAPVEPEAKEVDQATDEITAEDILSFITGRQVGQRFVLVSDTDEEAPKFDEFGVWRAHKDGSRPTRIELRSDDALVAELPLEAALSEDALKAIAARQKELTPASGGIVTEPVVKAIVGESTTERVIAELPEGGVVAKGPDQITVKIEADTGELEDDMKRVSGLLEGLGEKIAKMFSRKQEPVMERREPIVDTAPPMPSPEAIARARTQAAATRARLVGKGLI